MIKRLDPQHRDENLDELEELAKSAGYEVLDKITQVRSLPDKTFCIGKGKAQEIAEYIRDMEPEKVIFDEKLNAVQAYNLSKLFQVEVIDRFNLILEIFAMRARTKEAKLQVELANLIYERPRARMKVKLARRGEQPGFGGLGQYQADIYESEITGRIARIKEELETIRKRQDQTRVKRKERGFDMVALAGYTNAGKSTLMNALVGETVVAKDQLFTTLVPTTRLMEAGRRKVLLTDTVGFIKDLPHFMVEAFRSTLEEIYQADLIVLVVDASEPPEAVIDKLATCHDTLWGKIGPIPVITALNKCDKIDLPALERVEAAIVNLAPHPVAVSAKTGDGLEELRATVEYYLPKWISTELTLPHTEEGLSTLSKLYEEAIVRDVQYSTGPRGPCIRVSVDARESVLSRMEEWTQKGACP